MVERLWEDGRARDWHYVAKKQIEAAREEERIRIEEHIVENPVNKKVCEKLYDDAYIRNRRDLEMEQKSLHDIKKLSRMLKSSKNTLEIYSNQVNQRINILYEAHKDENGKITYSPIQGKNRLLQLKAMLEDMEKVTFEGFEQKSKEFLNVFF